MMIELPELDLDALDFDVNLDAPKKPNPPQRKKPKMKPKTDAMDVTIKETYDAPGHASVEIRMTADVTRYQMARAVMAHLLKYMEATESWKRKR